MPCYEINGMRPVVHPTAYVHPDAVLIGDVIIGPNCYVAPLASLRGDFGRLILGLIYARQGVWPLTIRRVLFYTRKKEIWPIWPRVHP